MQFSRNAFGFFHAIFLLALVGSGPLEAASPPGDVVGKITVGYQGWFACTGDDAPIGNWWHWSGTSEPPTPLTLSNQVHAWPDMRQFVRGYQTGFTNFGNGQPAMLFSSYYDQVVQTHFRWMAENELDTAALQRFNPFSAEGPTRNAMALKVKKAAEMYGRKFYIMYDLSGWTTMQNEIKYDWTNVITGQLQITNSTAYATQNGKPVVGIWGMGFDDANHPWDTNTCIEVINWFKSRGCYVMGGVPTWWRSGISDSRSNFLSVYKSFDMISPWMVGRIGDSAGSDWFYNNANLGDQAYCNANGIDYQPCVLPGDNGQRAHGDFMWRQFFNMKRTGAQGIYISMFDEYNEGNQIACTAEDASMIPVGSGSLYFTLDQDGTFCSSDYYLRLSRDGGRMLKGQIGLTPVRPTLPQLPASVPSQPTNVIAEPGNARIALAWNASSNAARYLVKRGPSGSGPFSLVATNVGLLSYTDSGLTNGITCYYVVTAANPSGESPESPPVSATPLLLGVAGDYYNNIDFTSPAFSRIDPGIDFDWGTGSPGPSMGVDTFSVRWNGEIQPEFSETYTFYTLTDDGVRLWVNGTQLINDWTGHPPTENNGSIALTAGVRYPIRMEYYEDGGGASAKLSWSSPNRLKQRIPENRLFPPGAPPAPTGLNGIGIASGQIKLTWDTVPTASRYVVRRASSSSGPYLTLATNVTNSSYTDPGLINGIIYFYEIAAANSFGQSADSLPVGAIPYPAAATASGENLPNETAAKAFDGLAGTKWFNGNIGNTGWLQFYFGGPERVVVRYDLTSANDLPGRDPKNWQFQGSHDGNSWTILDTRSGEIFSSRFQTKPYPISNTVAFAYYRLNVTANNGDASGLQLAELALVLGSNSQPALTPIQLSATTENNQLRIAWPADHTGWRLEMQTNSINLGLGTDWTTVAGTMTSNQFTVPIRSTDSVFFRLVYP
jgi:PA14 domain/F5/8 type C domain